MVPGSLGEHLHATVLVLLQTSPQLCSLPFSLHLPIGGIGRKRREEKKRINGDKEVEKSRETNEEAIRASNVWREAHLYFSYSSSRGCSSNKKYSGVR